jgi:hypothetical protein
VKHICIETAAKKSNKKPMQRLAAVSVIDVGNGAPTPDGSYLNARNIADTLAFTNVSITATSAINYVDAVNLGTARYGASYFNLTNTAPTTSILANVT